MRTARWRWIAEQTVVKTLDRRKKEFTKELRKIEDLKNVDDARKKKKEKRWEFLEVV